MPKYIQQITTGIVFISTPYLEKMANMRPISDSEAKKLLGADNLGKDIDPIKVDADPAEIVKVAKDLAAGKPVEPTTTDAVESTETAAGLVENLETVDPDASAKTFRELIEAAKTKEAVEALVLEHTGADIDRRKSLATLKAEALA